MCAPPLWIWSCGLDTPALSLPRCEACTGAPWFPLHCTASFAITALYRATQASAEGDTLALGGGGGAAARLAELEERLAAAEARGAEGDERIRCAACGCG
jgi:hypothetical protein